MGSKGSFNFAFLHGLEAVNDITFLHLQKELALNKENCGCVVDMDPMQCIPLSQNSVH